MPFAVALIAAAALVDPTTDDLSWMAGYWLSCEDGREVSETWSDPRAGLMVGYGVTVRNGRSRFETFRIAAHGDGVAYFAQPGGAPATAFPAVEVAPDRAVFADPAHDFPQRILYSRDGDMLTARIEGEIDGQARSMEWRFRRAELNARCPA